MRINWFEIPVLEMDRARKFYDSIFNIQMGDPFEMGEFNMSFFPYEGSSDGATGTLVQKEGHVPSHSGSVIYFSVKEINDILARVSSSGGKVLNEKMSIGDGFVAYFEDTEGNRIALHQQSQ